MLPASTSSSPDSSRSRPRGFWLNNRDDTTARAEVAVKWLKRAELAGQVAEMLLLFTGVGAALKAGRGAVATGEVAGKVAKREVRQAGEISVEAYEAKVRKEAADLYAERWLEWKGQSSVGGRQRKAVKGMGGEGFHKW